jgi:hypothetical protein
MEELGLPLLRPAAEGHGGARPRGLPDCVSSIPGWHGRQVQGSRELVAKAALEEGRSPELNLSVRKALSGRQESREIPIPNEFWMPRGRIG